MNRDFQKKADQYIPEIYKTNVYPVDIVAFLKDKNCYLETKKISVQEKAFYTVGDKVCIDFGRHITGNFAFELGEYKNYIDAPVRLKIKFAETPYEMRRDFSTYSGDLCAAWLQEEIITVDMKGTVSLSRRYAFRYVEISVLATPKEIVLKNFVAVSQTSADYSKLSDIETNTGLEEIDTAAVNTLSECMQDFFEDGPKRDRRLWLGDLRLQALANYVTFQNTDIVKRCLYLFAAFDSEEKLLPCCLYVTPELEIESGDPYLVSYALLFVVALCDYYEYTKDDAVTEDLFDTAKRQIDITERMLDENGILKMPKSYGAWKTFVDWAEVEPVTATMGIYIYAVECFVKLCRYLGKDSEAAIYQEFTEKLRKNSLRHLYDGKFFKNKYDKEQYSVHSHVWMILADVISKEEAKRILKECIGNSAFLAPVTPYMHHYVVEAFFKAEMPDEAKEYMIDYWGGMIDVGADTFWEAFVKDDPYVSPYNDVIMNSACHAWSCTPTYFIRKYGLK